MDNRRVDQREEVGRFLSSLKGARSQPATSSYHRKPTVAASRGVQPGLVRIAATRSVAPAHYHSTGYETHLEDYPPVLRGGRGGVRLLLSSRTKASARHQAWADIGLPVTVIAFSPVDEADLDRARDPTHIGEIMDRKTERFFHKAQAVADSLPHTPGAILAATRSALGSACACAPVSGFHDAGYDDAGGFCTTFNGLGIAARRNA